MHHGGFSHGIIFLVTNLRICELFLFNHTENRGVSRNNLCHDTFSLSRICELANYFFLITRSITENHGRQKFDNSGQEKKKRKSVTVRDIPCEDKNSIIRKLPPVGQWVQGQVSGQKKSVTSVTFRVKDIR